MIPAKKTQDATADASIGTDRKSYLQQKQAKEAEAKKQENEETVSNLQSALAKASEDDQVENLKEYVDAIVSTCILNTY